MKRFLLLLPFLAACSTGPLITHVLTPYRIDVRQGNFVTQEMVAQLKPGLSREQVRFILGTPLVSDMFHVDRWDYVYTFRHGYDEVQQRSLAVYFQDNKLTRVSGDVVAEDGSGTGASKTPKAPGTAAQVFEIGAPAAPEVVTEEKK